MPLPPLSVTLSDGQKIEVLKRFRAKYAEELKALDAQLGEVLTHLAEAEYLAAFLGEQPEVIDLRKRKSEADVMEKRRQFLGKLIDRLDQIIPPQPAVAIPAPGVGTGAGASGRSNVRRY
ncbi:MAG: hypothetical protein H0W72_13760 [Planctomycetes bacterium]|nr:hypothetical protein [Planctomycetota bacterium]